MIMKGGVAENAALVKQRLKRVMEKMRGDEWDTHPQLSLISGLGLSLFEYILETVVITADMTESWNYLKNVS